MLSSSDLSKKLSEAIKVVANIQPAAAKLRKASYESLAKTFSRIKQQDVRHTVDFDVESLKTLLLNAEDVEALKKARGDAILAIREACPEVASKIGAES